MGEMSSVSLLPLFMASCFRVVFLLLFSGIGHLCKEREGVITSKKGVGRPVQAKH